VVAGETRIVFCFRSSLPDTLFSTPEADDTSSTEIPVLRSTSASAIGTNTNSIGHLPELEVPLQQLNIVRCRFEGHHLTGMKASNHEPNVEPMFAPTSYTTSPGRTTGGASRS